MRIPGFDCMGRGVALSSPRLGHQRDSARITEVRGEQAFCAGPSRRFPLCLKNSTAFHLFVDIAPRRVCSRPLSRDTCCFTLCFAGMGSLAPHAVPAFSGCVKLQYVLSSQNVADDDASIELAVCRLRFPSQVDRSLKMTQ